MELKRWPSFLAMTFMLSFRAFALAQELEYEDKPGIAVPVPGVGRQSTAGAIVSEEIKDEDDKSVNSDSSPAIKLDDLLMQKDEFGSTQPAELPKYMIGVSLAEVPASLRAHITIDEGMGLMVGAVIPDSPAAKAGLQQYDIILKSGDLALKHPKELQALVDSAEEKPVSISIQRRGEIKTIEITPVKRETIKGTNNPYSVQLLPGSYSPTSPDQGNLIMRLPDGRNVQLAYPEYADQRSLVVPPHQRNQIDSLTNSIQSLTQQVERLQHAIDRLEQKSEAPAVNPPDEKSGDAPQ